MDRVAAQPRGGVHPREGTAQRTVLLHQLLAELVEQLLSPRRRLAANRRLGPRMGGESSRTPLRLDRQRGTARGRRGGKPGAVGGRRLPRESRPAPWSWACVLSAHPRNFRRLQNRRHPHRLRRLQSPRRLLGRRHSLEDSGLFRARTLFCPGRRGLGVAALRLLSGVGLVDRRLSGGGAEIRGAPRRGCGGIRPAAAQRTRVLRPVLRPVGLR